MSRTLVLFLATAAFAGAQQASSSIDREKLDLIRKMSPEERAKLKERLDQLKKLPAQEQVRLKENLNRINAMPAEEVRKLREKATKLTPQEVKDYSELAAGFGRWAHRNAEGFPRGLFFTWLKGEKPEKMDEIRSLEEGPGGPRINEFIKLAYDFRGVLMVRTEQHTQKHKCATPEDMKSLRDASFSEFWPRWQDVNRACQGRRANPGPVAPRPLK